MRALLLLPALLVAAGAQAQTPPPAREPEAARQGVDVGELPISVRRIEQGLDSPPALNLEVTRPLFRVEVIERRPPDWLENIDWLGSRDRIGPTPQIPSLHEQYIDRVTPKEAQMWSAFEGLDLLQIAITSFLQSLATQQVVEKVPDELREQREERARRDVDEAIERWQKMVEEERAKRSGKVEEGEKAEK